MKFIAGLTDVITDECFRYDDSSNNNEVRYNLYKLAPELERETIEWEIDTSIKAFVDALYSWEQTIRKPHLNLINISRKNNKYAPDHYDFDLSIHFMNLIPQDPFSLYKEIDSVDLSKLSIGGFGNLTIDFSRSISMASDTEYENTINHAYQTNNLENLARCDKIVPLAIPYFKADFYLGGGTKITTRRPIDYSNWLEENKIKLTELGYSIDDAKLNIGSLVIGKLIGDPWEQYEKLKKYSRICRVSFVN